MINSLVIVVLAVVVLEFTMTAIITLRARSRIDLVSKHSSLHHANSCYLVTSSLSVPSFPFHDVKNVQHVLTHSVKFSLSDYTFIIEQKSVIVTFFDGCHSILFYR